MSWWKHLPGGTGQAFIIPDYYYHICSLKYIKGISNLLWRAVTSGSHLSLLGITVPSKIPKVSLFSWSSGNGSVWFNRFHSSWCSSVCTVFPSPKDTVPFLLVLLFRQLPHLPLSLASISLRVSEMLIIPCQPSFLVNVHALSGNSNIIMAWTTVQVCFQLSFLLWVSDQLFTACWA